MTPTDRAVTLILPDNDYGVGAAYGVWLTAHDWQVTAKPLTGFDPTDPLTIVDFRIAQQDPERFLAAPAARIAIDYHFDPEHATHPLGAPFHLFDNATVIVHDAEGRHFVRRVVKAINPRTLLFPYPMGSSESRVAWEGERSIYVPTALADHPWLEGLPVTPVGKPWPTTVGAGSFMVLPVYHPTAWEAIRWAGAAGMPVVAPGLLSFMERLFAGGLLFDPNDPSDFRRKVAMLSRPAPKPVGEKLNVAVVVPFYKKDAAGGAEMHAGGLAKAFVDAGHTATVLATKTASMLSWNNELPDIDEVNGVPVRRFGVDNPDATDHHAIGHKVVMREEMSWAEMTQWMGTSIRSTAMEDHLADEADRYDALFFIPYLYGTTFWGSQSAPEKSYLVPCYHDEPHAYAKILRANASWVGGIFFNTYAEKRLAESTLKMRNPLSPVVGEGIGTGPGDADRFRARFNIDGPFVLYVGRLQREKNVPELLEFHAAMNRGRSNPIPLLLAGKGDITIDGKDGIRALGFVTEEEKRDAFAACSAFVLPSTKESFSIVMMEAWAQKKPVLAHAGCNVSREHLFTCGGGALYDDPQSYADAVSRLVEGNEGADMGRRGRDYVRERFTWPAVIERIETTLRERTEEGLAARLGRELQGALAASPAGDTDGFAEWLDRQPAEAAGIGALDDQPLSQLLEQLEDVTDLKIDYREFSTRPLFGTILSKIRGVMTNHLRMNYLANLERVQSDVNRRVARILKRLR